VVFVFSDGKKQLPDFSSGGCCAVGFALVLRWNVRKAKQVQKQQGYKNHDTTKPERLSRRA
jgi:hypothetical protein